MSGRFATTDSSDGVRRHHQQQQTLMEDGSKHHHDVPRIMDGIREPIGPEGQRMSGGSAGGSTNGSDVSSRSSQEEQIILQQLASLQKELERVRNAETFPDERSVHPSLQHAPRPLPDRKPPQLPSKQRKPIPPKILPNNTRVKATELREEEAEHDYLEPISSALNPQDKPPEAGGGHNGTHDKMDGMLDVMKELQLRTSEAQRGPQSDRSTAQQQRMTDDLIPLIGDLRQRMMADRLKDKSGPRHSSSENYEELYSHVQGMMEQLVLVKKEMLRERTSIHEDAILEDPFDDDDYDYTMPSDVLHRAPAQRRTSGSAKVKRNAGIEETLIKALTIQQQRFQDHTEKLVQEVLRSQEQKHQEQIYSLKKEVKSIREGRPYSEDTFYRIREAHSVYCEIDEDKMYEPLQNTMPVRRASDSHACSQPKTNLKVRANRDYCAREHDQLSLCSGDIITLTDIRDGTWWKGECRGKHGKFPRNHVKFGNDTN